MIPVMGVTDILLAESVPKTFYESTAKASSTSKFGQGLAYEFAKSAVKIGGAVASTLLGYKYLVDSGYIERGAEQFGTGYGHSLPKAYYESQVETMPLMEELKSSLYEQNAPTYTGVSIANIWAEAQAKAEAYSHYQPYYSGEASETQKASTKMPYRPRFK